MKYEVVIFDWDGTLMDSVGRIVSCLQTSAQQAALPVPTEAAVRDIIGLSLHEAFHQLFPGINDTQIEQMTALYRQEYVHNDNTPTPLFEGVRELLIDIAERGAKLAVATGKARAGLQRVLTATELEAHFHTSRCADEAQSKPAPDMIEQILAELGIAPEKALMVGDSQLDLKMANAAGVAAIGVSYGAHSVDSLASVSPAAIIHHPSELLHHL